MTTNDIAIILLAASIWWGLITIWVACLHLQVAKLERKERDNEPR